MDAGTGFTSQVYELSPIFLHKVWSRFSSIVFSKQGYISSYKVPFLALQDWIMEQWENNYYISAIAGATNGSSLVVMSKGLS